MNNRGKGSLQKIKDLVDGGHSRSQTRLLLTSDLCLVHALFDNRRRKQCSVYTLPLDGNVFLF